MTISRHRDGRGATPDFSLVLPTYNPGARLGRSLEELDSFAAGTAESWEFVIVCDGCTDGAAEMARNWSPRHAKVRVVSYRPNRGKGYAVRQGLLAAAAPFRIFTDIDLAYPFEDVRRVAFALRAGKPAVIASRTHAESIVQLPASLLNYACRRHLQSRLFGAFVRAILPLSHGDTQAGLKGFSERAVRLIVPHLRCDGFEFDCELLTACVRLGLEVTEVPVCVRYDGAGTTTGVRSGLRMVRELWRIRKAWPAESATTLAPTRPTAAPERFREAG